MPLASWNAAAINAAKPLPPREPGAAERPRGQSAAANDDSTPTTPTPIDPEALTRSPLAKPVPAGVPVHRLREAIERERGEELEIREGETMREYIARTWRRGSKQAEARPADPAPHDDTPAPVAEANDDESEWSDVPF